MDENTPPNAPATKLSPLYNTKFARESCLTQEHFCFVAYHDTKGTASPDLLKLLNDTFSLEQDMTDLEQAITYVHTNVKREEKLLLRANIYPWSSPLPPPAWPSRVTSYSVSNYESIYTDEVKAFMVWKYYLGFNKHQILDSLNRLFRTDHSSTALKSAMTILFKNEGTIARLRKDAQQYDWWKPPPPEDSIDGRRVARADRLREAKKRMTEKALVQKQAWKTQERADSEQWNL